MSTGQILEYLGYSLCIFCGITASLFVYMYVDHLLKMNDKALGILFNFIERFIEEDFIVRILASIAITDIAFLCFTVILAALNHRPFLILYLLITIGVSMFFSTRLVLIYLSRKIFPVRSKER